MELSEQEKRIEQGHEQTDSRTRVNRMLKGFRQTPPRIAMERARLLTESFKETEGLPIVLRWGKALENILKKIDICIGNDELIVGRCGPPGRYGILYPELRGAWLEKGLQVLPTRKEGQFIVTQEDVKIVREEILPCWKGKTVFEANFNLLPEDPRRLLYRDDDPYTSKCIILESTTDRTSLQWSLD